MTDSPLHTGLRQHLLSVANQNQSNDNNLVKKEDESTSTSRLSGSSSELGNIGSAFKQVKKSEKKEKKGVWRPY